MSVEYPNIPFHAVEENGLRKLGHDVSWDRAIEEVVAGLGDEKVTKYTFRRNGNGTPGHLRIPEAEEMAEELAAYIRGLGIAGWE